MKRRVYPLVVPARADGFPLGKTGGLIEAGVGSAGGSWGIGGFRWVKPAASLKREFSVRALCLHTLVSAG